MNDMVRTKVPRFAAFLLLVIVSLALCLRLYGMSWDQGFHLHPDERMLVMVTERIHLFDKMDPDFFNYGSLPIYILKGTAQILTSVSHTDYTTYDTILYVGRFVSVMADLTVLLLIYRLALILFKRQAAALFSAFIYAVAVFPIQNSHFFVVDVFLNLFVTATIYLLVLYMQKPSGAKIILLSLAAGAAITTKVTGVLVVPLCMLALLAVDVHKKTKTGFLTFIPKAIMFGVIFIVATFIFMPYAYIKFPLFLRDITLQTQMNSDAFIFPYTLQYVTTTPYLYYLKQIFLWGLGPAVSIFSIAGFILFFRDKKNTKTYWIMLLFYVLYFAVIGRSAVKFMRYMLPLYPFFILMAGYTLFVIYDYLSFIHIRRHIYMPLKVNIFVRLTLLAWVFVLTTYWTFAFVSIYSKTHSRIQATVWINKYISQGSVIATEHWDDRLPLIGSEKYSFEELPLYEVPDDTTKWQMIEDKLSRTDYIVIASNRLYTPLQKLKDCKKYIKCYPKTAEYYHKLFNNELNFTKIAEIAVMPEIKIGPIDIQIDDTNADESFTVYDHPKVLIFKNRLSIH